MKSTSETASQKMLAAVGRTVIVIFAVLATLEIVSYAAWSTARRFHHAPLRPETSPAYAGADWVPELYREQSSRMALRFTYVPFRVVGMAPWRGHYYNNDEHPSGVWRRTTNPECQQKQESKLWIFGGSTVYGTGVPDWATLPSSLSRNLNADSRTCMTVTNFGNEGYATTQELLLLIEQLKRSGSPDVVIFYDGFNDARLGMEAPDPWNTYSGWETIKPRAEGSFSGRFDFIHQFYTMRVLEAAQQLFRHTAASLNPDELRAKAVTVIDNYEANQSIARALSQTYHFKFYGFWQPMLFYGRRPQVPFEQQIVQLDATKNSRFDAPPALAAYQEAQQRTPKTFVFLANIFDSVTEPIYIDEAHLGPRGNDLAADAIAKYIKDHPSGREVDAPKER